MYLSDDMTPEELAEAAAEARTLDSMRRIREYARAMVTRRESGLLVPADEPPMRTTVIAGPWAVPAGQPFGAVSR